jgi:hypothetical protein
MAGEHIRSFAGAAGTGIGHRWLVGVVDRHLLGRGSGWGRGAGVGAAAGLILGVGPVVEQAGPLGHPRIGIRLARRQRRRHRSVHFGIEIGSRVGAVVPAFFPVLVGHAVSVQYVSVRQAMLAPQTRCRRDSRYTNTTPEAL